MISLLMILAISDLCLAGLVFVYYLVPNLAITKREEEEIIRAEGAIQ